MNFWLDLNTEAQLQELDEKSFHQPVVIYKHSTSCSISLIVKSRFDNNWKIDFPVYYLDLLSHRKISNLVAEKYQVTHESPQILIIQNGECIFDDSHLDINIEEVKSYLELEVLD